jgi:hypothetical protein
LHGNKEKSEAFNRRERRESRVRRETPKDCFPSFTFMTFVVNKLIFPGMGEGAQQDVLFKYDYLFSFVKSLFAEIVRRRAL